MSKLIRQILKSILSEKTFKKIENESKLWFMVCNDCGYSISYWDAGGLRYGGSRKKKVVGRCPTCNKVKVFKVIKQVH